MLIKKNFKEIQITETEMKLNVLLKNIDNNPSIDLAILCISKQVALSISAVFSLQEVYPKLQILILSSSDSVVHAQLFLRNGVIGFISKQAKDEELILAIHNVLTGNRYVDKSILEKSLNANWNASLFAGLATGEILVMQFLMEGYSVTSIARNMNVSVSQVNKYKLRIYRKLNVKSSSQLTDLGRAYEII